MFKPGQRVLYQTRPASVGHMAQICRDLYLSLANPVSARVLDVSGETVELRPDGWPLPVGVWPGGFSTVITRLKAYPESAAELRGALCNGIGQVYPPAEALQRALEYLSNAPERVFQALARDQAIQAVQNELRGFAIHATEIQ